MKVSHKLKYLDLKNNVKYKTFHYFYYTKFKGDPVGHVIAQSKKADKVIVYEPHLNPTIMVMHWRWREVPLIKQKDKKIKPIIPAHSMTEMTSLQEAIDLLNIDLAYAPDVYTAPLCQ